MIKIGRLVIEFSRLIKVLIAGLLVYIISFAFIRLFPPFPGWAALIVGPAIFTVLTTSVFEGLFRSQKSDGVKDFTVEITSSDGSKESTKIIRGDSDSVRKAAQKMRDKTE